MESKIVASKAAYNQLHGRWGLEFDHCRHLGGMTGPQRLVYRAPATDEFWTAWNGDREAVKSLGYQPRRSGWKLGWVVEREVPVPPGCGVTIYPSGWCALTRSATEPPVNQMRIPTMSGARTPATVQGPDMVERLPATELRKVTAEHIWNAVQKLSVGFKDHAFKESTAYDLIADMRLDPNVVFGVAATEALGFEVLPGHFSGGVGTACFRALQDAGYLILPKGEAPAFDLAPMTPDDWEWVEGRPVLIAHLKRERAAGLAAAKKASFLRTHGKLFCEQCRLDPIAAYGEHGDACIEVHHAATYVSDMADGHRTKLEELRCLCANCHRVEHRVSQLAQK